MPTHSRNTILLATDQQRSVLSALNAHGPHPIAYSPYGHRPAENGLLSLLGFNGEPPDPLTGCYHLGNGYRQFNPVLMRFNSPDSWSPFGAGGLNAYGYCEGDPRNSTDKDGHALVKLFNDSVKIVKIPRPRLIQNKSTQTLLADTAATARPSNKIGPVKVTFGSSANPSAGTSINNQTLDSPHLSTQGAAPSPTAPKNNFNPPARRMSLDILRMETESLLTSKLLIVRNRVVKWEKISDLKKIPFQNSADSYTRAEIGRNLRTSQLELIALKDMIENINEYTKTQLTFINSKIRTY